jgi:hypothetical protein
MLALVIDAAVLGVIIAAMEQDDFPGWLRAGACALLMSLVMYAISLVLPGLLALAGFVVAAIVGAFAISALCGMSVKRGAIAASIFLAYKLVMALTHSGRVRRRHRIVRCPHQLLSR